MRKLLGLSLAIIVLLVPASAHAYSPSGGADFNRPTGGPAQKFALMAHVNRAIQHTPRGQTILIATYYLDYKPSVDKLIAAHRRGVHVRVVMDGNGDGHSKGISAPARRLARVLNRSKTDKSFLVPCKGSCRGRAPGRNMHAKFFAFSRSGRATNIVMVSSGNLNKGAGTLGWNDMFTIVNKPAVYAKFAKIHAEMALDKPAPYQDDTFGRYQMRFFPQRWSNKMDPTRKDLSRVRCHGATGGSGRSGRTAINVAMFWWGSTRGLRLARQLIALDRLGCVVTIIYGAPSRNVAALLKRSAKNGGVALYDSRYDRNMDGKFDLRVHSKYLLINGNYRGDSSSWSVTMGSQNWSGGSLAGGDEVSLGIDSRRAYSQYMRNFHNIQRLGTRKIR